MNKLININVDERLLPEISTLKEKLKIQDRNTALKALDDGYVYPEGMYTIDEAIADLTEMEKEQPTPGKRRMMRLPFTYKPKKVNSDDIMKEAGYIKGSLADLMAVDFTQEDDE